MATKQIYFTQHDEGLTMLMPGGKQKVVSVTHRNFNEILKALKSKAFDKIDKLLDIGGAVLKKATTNVAGRRIEVRHGRVIAIEGGRERTLNGTLVERILADSKKDGAAAYVDALVLFLDNIEANKFKDIREELYEFLQSGKAPITYDGCFLAFKKVRGDFKDIYTGTMDNSPGKIVWMEADRVDTNRNQTCSTGLHFATRGYMSSYGINEGSRMVCVKVNPRHVMAIPTDYSFQKGRASEYYVVGEITSGVNTDAFVDSFINEDTKLTGAPGVKFVADGLKASLETKGIRYGIIKNGKVFIESKKGVYMAVQKHTDGRYYDVHGKPDESVVKSMSFETKSVREAVKYAVEILENK